MYSYFTWVWGTTPQTTTSEEATNVLPTELTNQPFESATVQQTHSVTIEVTEIVNSTPVETTTQVTQPSESTSIFSYLLPWAWLGSSAYPVATTTEQTVTETTTSETTPTEQTTTETTTETSTEQTITETTLKQTKVAEVKEKMD